MNALRFTALLLFGTLSGMPMIPAQSPMLLVVNQGDRNLSVIDPATGRQTTTIAQSAVTGHEIAVYPVGHRAFVPIYGDSGVGKPGTDGRAIDVVDLATLKHTATIDLGRGVRPHCAVYDPVSRMLYVTTELDKSITIIDPTSLKIVGSIPTLQEQSHMLAISHDGSRGYTANVGPGTVSVLDMKTHKAITVISISGEIQRISISHDNSMVFTADQKSPRLAVIDTAANKLKTWIDLPSLAYGTTSTNDGRWLLVALPAINKVAVIDLETLTLAHTIDVGAHPVEILMRPDGLIAYVSCIEAHEIAAIDLKQWKVEKLIQAGKSSDGMAWSPAR